VQPNEDGDAYVTVAFQITGLDGKLDTLEARISYDVNEFEVDRSYGTDGIQTVDTDYGAETTGDGNTRIIKVSSGGTLSYNYTGSAHTILTFRMKMVGNSGTLSFGESTANLNSESCTISKQSLHVSKGTEQSTTYNVYYDANNGTLPEGVDSPTTVSKGGTVTLPAAPTRSGYTFDHWALPNDNTKYVAGDTYTPT
jgi:hypothetical protein